MSGHIEFVFNIKCEFVSVKVEGTMSLYTDPSNFIGRNVRDVLPEAVASITLISVNKCIATGEDQEYDYELAGSMYHAKLTRTTNSVVAIITSTV